MFINLIFSLGPFFLNPSATLAGIDLAERIHWTCAKTTRSGMYELDLFFFQNLLSR